MPSFPSKMIVATMLANRHTRSESRSLIHPSRLWRDAFAVRRSYAYPLQLSVIATTHSC
jgi:hypothetical protein